MEKLLAQVISNWEKNHDYHDVSGKLWVPGSSRLERCPNGCHLEISEMPINWERVQGHDAYRQTRICRAHGFARIYLVSGPTAAAHNWNPSSDLKQPDFEEAKSIGVIGIFGS